ncbi:MAG: recombinase family protein [Chloroflexi bacterium]|nr:recombinase family protein [Chloroflexota bacterium]
MDAIGYFRVDSARGKNEALPSVEEQEVGFLRFCERQGFQPAATFFDGPSTARGSGRGYRQLVEYLRQPDRGFTVVVVGLVPDLAREPRETVRRLLELEYLGARVVAAEPVAEDPLEEALESWRRQRGRERLSDRALDTLRSKAMRGYGLGKMPYGYRIGSHGRLEVVPEEAQVVRQIYQMYAQDTLGLRKIARFLNDAGTSTRRGSRWSVVTVRDILRNRVYIGTYVRFGVRVPGSHEAIIPADLFRQAQRKRESASGGRPPGRQTSFLLTGLALCGYCGARMIGVSRRQSWSRKRDGGHTEAEYRYYRCGSRVNQSVCDYHTWRARELEEAVLAAIGQQLSVPLPPETDEGTAAAAEVRTSLRARLRSLEGRFDRHLDGAARGDLSLTGLRTALAPLLRETQHVELRLQTLEGRGRRSSAGVLSHLWGSATASDLMARWNQLTPVDQRLLLGDLVQQVVVHDGRVDPVLHR